MMKTNTKRYIFEFIKKNGPTRPNKLYKKLAISPQAVHIHLKQLTLSKVLERVGSPPFTTYTIAGIPTFEKALTWFQATKISGPSYELCETRDTFSARLSKFVTLENRRVSQNDISLIISMCGEIGNNSFDHNLGQWKDIPGCWLETQLTQDIVWILIADRGQGIYQSLSRVIKNIPNDQVAIEKAFNEKISGRSPENRGNGLKFVKNIITEKSGRGLACRSGNGQIDFGDSGKKCATILSTIQKKNVGTITLIAWELYENRD